MIEHVRVQNYILCVTGVGKRAPSFTCRPLGCKIVGQGEGWGTSEIMGIQRASYPSAGIPPAWSDNGTGRKECAGCRTGSGVNETQDRVPWGDERGTGMCRDRKGKSNVVKPPKMQGVCVFVHIVTHANKETLQVHDVL